MKRRSWKASETRIARRYFDAERTPLSGEMSGHTSSDTLSETYYVELKSIKDVPRWEEFRDLRQRAKRYDKQPLIVLSHPERGHLGIMEVERAKKEALVPKLAVGKTPVGLFETHEVRHEVGKQLPFFDLVEDTEAKAEEEDKVPVVVLTQKRCPGAIAVVRLVDDDA